METTNDRLFLRENIDALTGRPESEDLLRALEACRRADRRRRPLRAARAAARSLGGRLPAPVKRQLRPLVGGRS
jgi:hypothetical protein